MSNRTIVKCGSKQIDHLYFNWTLTNACNFRCSYCIASTSLTTLDQINAKRYKIALATLKTVETTFDICLTGGEPTYHPHIEEIVTELNNIEKIESILLFTNLTRPKDFYNIFDGGLSKLFIFASFHPEYYEIEKFVEKSKHISDNINVNFRVHVTLHDKKEFWDKTITLIEQLKKHNIDYKPCLLETHNSYDVNYDDEFYNIFKPYLKEMDDDKQEVYFRLLDCEFDNGTTDKLRYYEIEEEQLNKFKGYKCTPAIYYITEDGITHNSCTNEQQSLKLSNDNIIKVVICPKETCSLRAGMDYYKEK